MKRLILFVLLVLLFAFVGSVTDLAETAPTTNAAPPAEAPATASTNLPSNSVQAAATNAPPAAAVETPDLTNAPVVAKAASTTNAPAATASTNAAPERNIRFQFDGIPYSDVLERFSQMVHKPLVADTNIQGTLTFNDPRPYTYQEALDTLNLMLSMKEVMLVESDHYLRLVPFKELPQMPLKILRGTDDHNGDVRPDEVVTVVLMTKNIDSKDIADSITSMLSGAGSLATLGKGRGLIVTDKLANIQRIQ